MRYSLCAAVLVTLVGCGDSDDSTGPGTPPREISGTVTVPASLQASAVMIGPFVDVVFADGDTINRFFGSPPYMLGDAVTVSGGTTSRAYSYTLPDDPETFIPGLGALVAFIDLDGNGAIDLADEPARLPLKVIDGTQRVISGWGYLGVGNDPLDFDYLVYDGAANSGLLIVGASGFDFRF